MAYKIIDTTLDMYGNTVQNVCIETVMEIPASIDVGRIVYLSPAKEIYVCTEEGWKTAGQVNPFENIKVNGEIVTPVDGAVNIVVPTRTSHLVNDSGYITKSVTTLDNFYTKEETYNREELDSKLQAITQFDFRVVDALPETGEWGYIYLVPSPASKSKNTKDEYIWVDGAWEQIGSTQFKLDLVQDADGITVNNTALQKATEAQDGLMTKEMVREFRGKQDALSAGANITIENGVISATGGGAGGGHSSVVREFGGDGQTEYIINHNLGTYNILIQLRTVAAPIRYITTTMEAVDTKNLRLTFNDPLTETLSVSIMACDKVVVPSVLDVDTKSIETAASVWSMVNTSGQAVYCQLYDSDGNEIRGDMVQESADGFTPVVASLDRPYTGTMLIAKASIFMEFSNQTEITIDTVQNGFAASDKFLVQVYLDGTGRTMPDIIQDNGTGIISIDLGDEPLSGYIVARKATMVQEFTSATEIVCTHNLNRVVGVQAYLEGSGQVMADIVCTDLNTVTVSSNNLISGYVLVL